MGEPLVHAERYIDPLIYRATQSLFRVILGIFFPLRVSGTHSVLDSGKLLIIANHQSFLDPVLMGTSVDRPIRYLARATLFKNRLFGRLIQALNAIKIERDGNATAGIRTALACLGKERALVLYPEGTRTSDGAVGALKPGFLLLARKSKAPVVIAGIAGAFECWPRHRTFPTAGPIWIHFERWKGDPNSSTEEMLASLQEQLCRVQAIAAEKRRRSYGQ
ncbi:1-acyl-sn-glycerol-3-phosphate acyltransferase [Planctomycetes bacterium Pan216]|uniref:1-acyl-sn-glycerol-3-phosphate acyltransferase n=1 Tax=Kolteria novifilia TaxID=2527975 RepID=A0A518B0R2_9BACT|nr:1-acyl-sn-glycerol-3-phosphate acyltransferase [Planctomycetes bacterium Pan216]